jgi:hypothetical protein
LGRGFEKLLVEGKGSRGSDNEGFGFKGRVFGVVGNCSRELKEFYKIPERMVLGR